jgi:hypothetical protein
VNTFLAAIAVKFSVREEYTAVSHFDVFGVPLRDIPFILKTTELEAAWKVITSSGIDDKKSNRSAVYYFHGSSGIGKTYLFRMLMSYEGVPEMFQSHSQNTLFLILNFNNGAIPVEEDRILFFKSNPKLFIFLRIFWSRFVSSATSHDDISTQWGNFLDCLFDKSNPLSSFLSTEMVEPLSNFFKTLIAGETKKTVLLVDELEKSEPIGAKDNIRELICRLIGNTFTFVFFSALDVELLRSKVTPSDRQAIPISGIVPLSPEETFQILDQDLPPLWHSESPASQESREFVVQQLAVRCGGHPKTVVQFLRAADEGKTYSHLHELLNTVLLDLDLHLNIKLCFPLVIEILLARKVQFSDTVLEFAGRIWDNKGMTHTFNDLVKNNYLIGSYGGGLYTPQVPEVFLYEFVKGLPDNVEIVKVIKSLLQLLLATNRDHFKAIEFETFHILWEKIMRLVYICLQQSLNVLPASLTGEVPLTLLEMYKIKPENYHSKSASYEKKLNNVKFNFIHMEFTHQLISTEKFQKKSKILLEPNHIYSPADRQNAGFDRLIIYKSSNSPMLIPVFIQNKFSENNATTVLDYNTVQETYNNSRDFLSNFAIIDGKQVILKQERFLLVMAIRRETTGNIYDELQGNVYILDNAKLKELYGPSLTALLFSFTQEGPFSVVPTQGSASDKEEKEVSTQTYFTVCCNSKYLFSY